MERDNLIGAKKDKTVSEETLDPETDIDGQVESEQVDGAELGVEMQGRTNLANLRQNREKMIQNECSLLVCRRYLFFQPCFKCLRPCGGIGGVLERACGRRSRSLIFYGKPEFPFSDRGTQAADKQFTFRVSPSRVSIFYRRSDQIS